MPGLNAAFVDVGYEKDAFLHYLDLGPQVLSLLKLTRMIKNGSSHEKIVQNLKREKDIDKTGKISQVVKRNMLQPVEITKEPISTKGRRLSSDLSIAGRLSVVGRFWMAISIAISSRGNAEHSLL